MSTAALDNVIRIVTPENIAFEYRLAGPFRRSVAYVIDFVLRALVIIGILIVVGLVLRSQASIGIVLVAFFILDWGYGGIFEALWNGQTPGKRLLSIRVVSTDGLPINGQQAFLRNFLRVVDSFFYFFVAGLSFLITKRFQRLGDLASDTMVVLEEQHTVGRNYPIPHIPDEVDSLLPATFAIDEKLADAIGTYVARRPILTSSRRTQLANILVAAIRTRFELPADVDEDLLLCALYRRVFQVSNRAATPTPRAVV